MSSLLPRAAIPDFGLLLSLGAWVLPFTAQAAGSSLYRPAPPVRAVNPPLAFAQSPQWFRRTPALYVPAPRSAGAVMLSFVRDDSPALPDLISSFRDLPALLDQARSLGTDTVYLVDYYQGWPDQPAKQFWLNKGDYIPRSDLGGTEAFKEGIRAVHEGGGRVIVYVEAFIISKHSAVGQAHGADWSILTPQGPLTEPYPGNWHLCSACPGWVDYVTGVCRRLVGEYGVDGVHLDSYGAQKNWRCVNAAHGHEPSRPEVFNQGCVELVRRIREAIQKENPQAVVMCELPGMAPLFPYLDGSQDWGIHSLSRRPVWNAAGRTNIFTAGWSLDDIHQILALGYNLSLGGYWLQALQGPSCLAALPSKRPPAKGAQGRQRFIEQCLQTLHQWRNAGLLLGLRMPDVEDVSPRRMQREEIFRSEESTEALFQRIRERAKEVDAALQSRGAQPLPSPVEHLRRLLDARKRLSPLIDDGAVVEPLDCGGAPVAAYCFTSPAGCVLTAVNVGNEAAEVSLRLPPQAPTHPFVDEATGQTLSARNGAIRIPCPAHSLRLSRK